jgi:PKD domain
MKLARLVLCWLAVVSSALATQTVTLTVSPLEGIAPLAVTLTASCAPVVCVAYAWDFGDGTANQIPGATQTHTYINPGSFDVLVVGITSKAESAFTDKIIAVDSNLTTLCGETPPWADSTVGIYTLPPWITALSWVQPADFVYAGNQYPQTHITYDDSGNNFPPINTRAGDTSLYCQWVMVQGGTPSYSYSISGQPPGLSLQTVGLYAIYGGIATTPGVYSVSLCATDSAGTEVCTSPRKHQVCDSGKSACILP